MKIKYIIIFFLVYLLTLNTCVLAQNHNKLTTVVIPPTPNAASLAKYGDIPVSYHTGTPQISIPLYEIKSGSLSLPISLSYHASGIKVDEVASWVGLGWSLNAGGMISRTIRGCADEMGSYGILGTQQRKGFFITGNKQSSPADLSNPYFLHNVSLGKEDLESDLYFFNLPNITGKFFFDPNKNIYQTELSDIKIEIVGSFKWKITDASGIKYYFGNAGVDEIQRLSENPDDFHVSAWHLNRMESADGVDFIEFEYNNMDAFSYPTGVEYTKLMGNVSAGCDNCNPQCFPPSIEFNPSYSSVKQKLLSKITFNSGYVIFVPAPTPRIDLSGAGNFARYLSEVLV